MLDFLFEKKEKNNAERDVRTQDRLNRRDSLGGIQGRVEERKKLHRETEEVLNAQHDRMEKIYSRQAKTKFTRAQTEQRIERADTNFSNACISFGLLD